MDELVQRFEKELETVMRFWLRHSHDSEHGYPCLANSGFYNCLSETGEVYDALKYCWLQGRQVWMYAKLYNSLPSFHTDEVLQAAERGAEFLMNHVRVSGQARCYFAVSADGQPARLQRKPYTESFYTIAMSELYRATGKEQYRAQAEEMLAQLIHWIRIDDSGLGVDKLPGVSPCQELARPMVLLNTITEFCGSDHKERERFEEDLKWCRQEILKHHHGQWVLEHVSPDGSTLPGSHGRLSNPGHALEAGWFLLQEADTLGDKDLAQRAIDHFIQGPYTYGWDREYGGLYYFLDSEGHSPTQLEWSMKLWWVHCEAMVALLMAFRSSQDASVWSQFTHLCDYTFSKVRWCRDPAALVPLATCLPTFLQFVDASHREWYGYLTREGKVNQRFKGGPYKGCFHVPRCLLLCWQMLKELAADQQEDTQ